MFIIFNSSTFANYISFWGEGHQEYYDCCIPSETFSLTVVGANQNYTYTWYIGQTQVGSGIWLTNQSYPNQTTTYRCTEFTGETTNTYYFTITVNITAINMTVSGSLCCANGGTVYANNLISGFPYELYKNGTSSSNYVSGSTKTATSSTLTWNVSTIGTYYVKIVYDYTTSCRKLLNNSCKIDHECCKNTTEISESNIDNTIKVYPNPAKYKVTVEISSEGNYLLINTLGQVIKEINANKENSTFEFTSLTPGVYFIKNNNTRNNESIKFNVIE